MLVSWVLFPLLLTALCLGCGLLLEACLGRRLPGLLLAPAGFAVLVVIAAIFTSSGGTARFASVAVVVAALLGLAFAFPLAEGGERLTPWSGRRPEPSAIAAALGVFVVFAAPVVLSGSPTFTGYIKLDDTATWLAFVDRLMDHGRDLGGLEPSSYLRTLEVNLPSGYPVGAFLPLGVGSQLTGTDPAWLVQPYMATMAGLLAACLVWLAGPLVGARWLRALVGFGAAQSALLFAYSLWGGIKEVTIALAIAVLAALAPAAAEEKAGWRAIFPAAVASVALVTMLGSRAIVWIGPILLLVALGLWRARGFRTLLRRGLPLIAAVTVLGVLAAWDALQVEPTGGTITSAAEIGNLVRPLKLAQLVGIWPTGDFRFDPINQPLTTFLIALALIAAMAGASFCWRRRAWPALVYVLGTLVGTLVVFAASSPWIGGKALASGSPALLFLALAGAAALARNFERVLGATVLALVLAGVIWSNALGYHDVSLAPYDQLRELEQIGEEFAGEGPTLMTEYQPYGVRHFLRAADAEGVSELRSRSIPLREGGEAEKGAWVDTDQISLSALLTYRTLVLRRNPGQSRPPSAYSLVRHGAYYDVWQRSPASPAIGEHLPLGSLYDPGAEPSCAEVQQVGALAGPGGTVLAPERAATVSASLSEGTHPGNWTPLEAGGPALLPHGPGVARVLVDIPASGRYGFYLQGSARNRIRAYVEAVEVGSVAEQLNAGGQFLYFGARRLSAGRHEIELELEGQTLAPGSGGPPEAIGPLVLSPVRNLNPPLLEVPAARARSLCGRHLDWLEALPAG